MSDFNLQEQLINQRKLFAFENSYINTKLRVFLIFLIIEPIYGFLRLATHDARFNIITKLAYVIIFPFLFLDFIKGLSTKNCFKYIYFLITVLCLVDTFILINSVYYPFSVKYFISQFLAWLMFFYLLISFDSATWLLLYKHFCDNLNIYSFYCLFVYGGYYFYAINYSTYLGFTPSFAIIILCVTVVNKNIFYFFVVFLALIFAQKRAHFIITIFFSTLYLIRFYNMKKIFHLIFCVCSVFLLVFSFLSIEKIKKLSFIKRYYGVVNDFIIEKDFSHSSSFYEKIMEIKAAYAEDLFSFTGYGFGWFFKIWGEPRGYLHVTPLYMIVVCGVCGILLYFFLIYKALYGYLSKKITGAFSSLSLLTLIMLVIGLTELNLYTDWFFAYLLGWFFLKNSIE